MKTFRLIGMALVAMCLCMNFASCSNEEVISVDPQGEKYVTVGLGCAGEFLEFSDSPLSRTSTEELYGIQVYALTPNGKTYWNEETGKEEIVYDEIPYAYGMFTSLDDVKIRLLEGHKYKFEVSIVIDPFKNTYEYIKYYWFGQSYVNEHINTYGSEFVYTSNTEINLRHIRAGIYNGERFTQYVYDRYYGELDKYTPQEKGSVEVNTKRVVYGVKYETTGLSDGESLTVDVRQDIYNNLYSIELSSESNEDIYTFDDIRNAWEGSKVWNESTEEAEYVNYTSDKKLTITWNKADGTTVPMGTYNVTFKRNVMTAIKIKAENLNMDNGIKVFKEEVAMVDDENIYEITGGTVTEVPVVPGN